MVLSSNMAGSRGLALSRVMATFTTLSAPFNRHRPSIAPTIAHTVWPSRQHWLMGADGGCCPHTHRKEQTLKGYGPLWINGFTQRLWCSQYSWLHRSLFHCARLTWLSHNFFARSPLWVLSVNLARSLILALSYTLATPQRRVQSHSSLTPDGPLHSNGSLS